MNTKELPEMNFQINAIFAKSKNIPVFVKGIVVAQTLKAVMIKGTGLIDPKGRCSCCGRVLTHPGSILIGMGPECLGNWGTRKEVLEHLTPEDIRILRAKIESIEINCWVPKTCIKSQELTGQNVVIAEEKPAAAIVKPRAITFIPDKDRIKVEFPYETKTVEEIKKISGRFWDCTNKWWEVPATKQNLQKFAAMDFTFDKLSKKLLEELSQEAPLVDISKCDMNGLMDFQKDGVNFLVSRNGKAIIGDEMGLGKTVQVLSYIKASGERPAVVVVPASLKYNWKKEAEKWVPGCDVQILSGKSITPITGKDIVIINYDIISAWENEIIKLAPKILVLDECHYIKNNKSIRTKSIKKIAKKIPHIIPISGTPAINRPIELYNAIKLVEPDLFPSYFSFGTRYCDGHQGFFGWDFSGASNLEELYDNLKSIMIRRKKADVLKDMPDKMRSFISLELENEARYKTVEEDFLNWVESSKGPEAAMKARAAETLTKMSALRKIAVELALKNSIDWIENFIDGSDQKLVVFAIHRDIIDKLMAKFGDIAVKIDGSTPADKRQEIVDEFQTGSKRIFIGNIKAAGVGITLTSASNVAFLEMPWTPGELDQAEDRCHRIGQKNAVNIYYLLGKNTIEEVLCGMIDEKRAVLSKALDGKEMCDSDSITLLMNKLF